MNYCRCCGNESMLKVSETEGVSLYSCCNEECVEYAELYVEIDDGVFIHYSTLYDNLKNVIKNGKADISEGDS